VLDRTPKISHQILTTELRTFIQENVGRLLENVIPFDKQTDMLTLVAVRFEFCFECVGTDKTTRYAVRLVYQPRFAGEGPSLGDGAMHFIYVEDRVGSGHRRQGSA
jgi:hypothetical protein